MMNGTLASIIVAIIIVAIIVLDLRYIIKKKKQGTCIGCPESGNGKCSCHCHD
ncbi:MAG: FeoB-associated Cys-rich membrane protein [Lachnospiraceae bacterium]|nr:FeoB-associated Cys-rich membrane protein [Lachnospiraceae bacterium]